MSQDYQTYLNDKSTNRKTGPIPVSTTTAATCPAACPFRNNGCYADSFPLKGRWAEVTEHKRGGTFAAFLHRVAALPEGQFWRHNQAGDLPGANNKLDRRACLDLAKANAGKRGFTYTHYPATAHNKRVVAEMNALGFTVNLSGNNPAHADELADAGVGPVVMVLPDADAPKRTPKGRRIVVCPATYRDDVTCASCQLCQRQRDSIVGFPAHGSSKRKAATIAAAS